MCRRTMYPWLPSTEVARVYRAFAGEFFYRAVRESELRSYRDHGIDPAFGLDRSRSAAASAFEPGSAARFCTLRDIGICLSAVRRGEFIDPSVPERDPPVLLRVSSGSILGRAFGLDHSFSPMHNTFLSLTHGNRPLSAAEFENVVRRFGVISSFEVIPATEIQFSLQLDGLGDFLALLSLSSNLTGQISTE